MQESSTTPEERVYLIGRPTVQSRCFADRLSEHISVSLHVDAHEALSIVSLRRDGTSVLLIDASYVEIGSLLEEIAAANQAEGVLTALMNVNRHAADARDYVTRGIRGLFYEDDSFDLVVKGVRALVGGGVWISRETLFEAAVGRTHETHNGTNGFTNGVIAHKLTRREKEIIGLICIGATNKEIADKLFISPNTVKTHVYKIYKKIDAPNRMQAALWGAQNL
ncbi:MAG: hypothetical protein EA426_19630 [Spirochaetaceae bacterium]|nr:MAG: hypothetical protein EA426_19630 [Spirochaetaceae bacterium]